MAKIVKKTGDELLPTEDDAKKIEEALKIVKDIDKKAKELEDLKEKLEPIIEHFNDKLTHGASITTALGSAVKTVTNKYDLKAVQYPKVLKLFGADVAKYVTTTTKYGVTALGKTLLKDTKHKQRKAFAGAVVVTSTSLIKFKPKSK